MDWGWVPTTSPSASVCPSSFRAPPMGKRRRQARKLAWQTPLIPSVIFFQDAGRAIIGRPSLSAREILHGSDLASLGPLARSFKKTLARASQQAVAQIGSDSISARHCATIFLRELLE